MRCFSTAVVAIGRVARLTSTAVSTDCRDRAYGGRTPTIKWKTRLPRNITAAETRARTYRSPDGKLIYVALGSR